MGERNFKEIDCTHVSIKTMSGLSKHILKMKSLHMNRLEIGLEVGS